MFVEKLSGRCFEMLKDLGVEVHLDCHVTEVGLHSVCCSPMLARPRRSAVEQRDGRWGGGREGVASGAEARRVLGPRH